MGEHAKNQTCCFCSRVSGTDLVSLVGSSHACFGAENHGNERREKQRPGENHAILLHELFSFFLCCSQFVWFRISSPCSESVRRPWRTSTRPTRPPSTGNEAASIADPGGPGPPYSQGKTPLCLPDQNPASAPAPSPARWHPTMTMCFSGTGNAGQKTVPTAVMLCRPKLLMPPNSLSLCERMNWFLSLVLVKVLKERMWESLWTRPMCVCSFVIKAKTPGAGKTKSNQGEDSALGMEKITSKPWETWMESTRITKQGNISLKAVIYKLLLLPFGVCLCLSSPVLKVSLFVVEKTSDKFLLSRENCSRYPQTRSVQTFQSKIWAN